MFFLFILNTEIAHRILVLSIAIEIFVNRRVISGFDESPIHSSNSTPLYILALLFHLHAYSQFQSYLYRSVDAVEVTLNVRFRTCPGIKPFSVIVNIVPRHH